MSPLLDATARAPTVIEAPSGLSEREWYRGPLAASGTDVATIFESGPRERTTVPALLSLFDGRTALLRKVELLLRLQANWDSYGAPAISPTAAFTALQFLEQLPAHAPRPSLVPTSKGGLQIEWHAGGVDIEIECMATGHAHFFADDGDAGEVEERWIVPGHPALHRWLLRLARPR